MHRILLTTRQVPDNYLRAIFGSYLASRFVYEFGASASQFAFFDFMSKRVAKANAQTNGVAAVTL